MPAHREELGALAARLLIDLTSIVSVTFLRTEDPATSSDLVLICAALLVGKAERKPMTATKVAATIGMPRPSVIRKLRLLHMRGIVARDGKTAWRIAVEHGEIAARADAVFAEGLRVMRRAVDAVSRLDAQHVAGTNPRT